MTRLRLYDYAGSGNCPEVRILLGQLGIDYERVEVDIFVGDTLTDSYAQVNPARQTPVLELDGTRLPGSNAILWYLAEGTDHLPVDPLGRASVVRFLLFEQTQLGQLAELRLAPEAGFELSDHPALAAWIERVEGEPGFVNDLAPLPDDPIGRGLSIYG